MPQSLRIISTLGPRSANRDFVHVCAEVGQPNFRLNGSHLTATELGRWLDLVMPAFCGSWISLDLQGAKRRIGEVDPYLIANKDSELLLSSEPDGLLNTIPVPHPELIAEAQPGDTLVLQDGTVTLEVTERSADHLRAVVRRPGRLRSRCGIHLKGKSLVGADHPGDRQLIRVAAERGVHALAFSYLVDRQELDSLRGFCKQLDYTPTIIAKIERPAALANLERICAGADEVWFCRGDLGSLVPWRELGAWQASVIATAIEYGRPITIAGQVFQHLTEHPEPTRSEVVHLHDIITAGAAGIVLSDETAIGQNPVNALRTVAGLL